MPHPEKQYLELLRTVASDGSPRVDRTKVGTRAVFGAQCRFDLSEGVVPILTTKKVLWKAALKELLWFLSGETNIAPLLREGVTIWTDWPLARYRKETGDGIEQAEFEKRLVECPRFAEKWGDLGPVYGKQWRRWRDYDGGEIDQVSRAVEMIRKDPYSRRIIIEGWNVAELHLMALTPCHKTYQFFVSEAPCGERRLSLLMSQRSVDMFLGLPFNLASCGFFLNMMAQQCDMRPGELIWQAGDTHVYDNHHEAVSEQLARSPLPWPTLSLRRADSILDYRFEDFEVVDYRCHGAIKAPVAV